jgi:hypothetical protein
MITVTGSEKARRQLAGLCQAEMREIHAGIAGLDPVKVCWPLTGTTA